MISKFFSKYEVRIAITSGLTLIILALLVAISVFTIMQRQTESLLSNSLEVALQNKIYLIEELLKNRLTNAQASTRLFLIQEQEQELIKVPHYEKESAPSFYELTTVAEKLLQQSFSGITIHDNEANEIVSVGNIPQFPMLIVDLKTSLDIRASLLWDKQFILRTYMDIMNEENQRIGSIITDQPLPVITRIVTESYWIGKTGSFMLCAAVQESNLEMDCFLHSIDGNEFKRLQRIISNKPLPMHFSLDGKSGIQFANDYRQVPVIAAHAPVAYGMGAVLKIDEQELYEPIRENSNTIILYFSVLLICGILASYWLLMPLVNKLAKSERKLLKTNFKLNAYIDAIGKLALISITDKDGNITQVNEKFCKISGYCEEELIGQSHRILNSGTHPQEFFVEMWKTIKRGEIWHQEICNRGKNGTTYWVDSTIVPIKNVENKIDGYLSVRTDITVRKKNEIALHERLKESTCLQAIRFELGLNLTHDTLFQKIADRLLYAIQYPDIATVIIKVNDQQYTAQGHIAKNVSECITQRLQAHILVNGEKKGQLLVFYTIDLPFLLPEEQDLIDAIAYDIGRWLAHKENEKLITRMATHDALTDLPNRHLLLDRMEHAIAHDSRRQLHMAILFIDLDHFKIINDSLGHTIGDLLLKEVSKRLITAVRAEDTVARQGGDEFIVVLDSITDIKDASIVSEKILYSLKQPFILKENVIHIGCSIGIALFPNDGLDAETLLKNSDIAMYHAKESGRNNFRFFTEEMILLAKEKHNLSIDLRHAVEHNELVLFFQPVFSMPNRELRSLEVLLRWEHPSLGLIPPIKFIPLAEENGLILSIGEWVLQNACEQIKTWKEQGYMVPRLAINLSAKQFHDNKLVDKIKHILEKNDVDTGFISLELTESALTDNVEDVVEKLFLLNKMGIKILIDDFGTGYSSLSYLKRFPINTLKIDRSFVQNIETDKNDQAIIAAIIAMSENLGIDIIAEGVETEEQLNMLIQYGCDQFQGYYFSKPLPASEIEKKFRVH